MHRVNLPKLPAFLLALLLLAAFAASVFGDTQTTPPAAGKTALKTKIGPRPLGKIAFIVEGAIWVMDSDGKNRYKVSQVGNARGRLSFSPNNKMIAFSREGRDVGQLPSDEGGSHQLHDIFIAYLDSAATKTNFWRRVSFTLGAHNPQWYNDTLIYVQNDLNANFVDYLIPSHQLARVNPTTTDVIHLRKDYKNLKTSIRMPAISNDGRKIAVELFFNSDPEKYDLKKYGIKILNMADVMIPETELRKPTKGLESAISPAWSPDGQWLAYLNNDMRNPGIYIIKSDLSETRLIYAPTISQGIGDAPVGWAPDSKWITFATTDGTIYLIDINGEQLTALTGTGNNTSPAWSR